jgi:hypothetical protein
LPSESTTPEVPVEKFSPGVVDPRGKFASSEVDTSEKFAAGVVDTYGGTTLTCE